MSVFLPVANFSRANFLKILHGSHYMSEIMLVCISEWSNGFVGLKCLRKAHSPKRFLFSAFGVGIAGFGSSSFVFVVMVDYLRFSLFSFRDFTFVLSFYSFGLEVYFRVLLVQCFSPDDRLPPCFREGTFPNHNRTAQKPHFTCKSSSQRFTGARPENLCA